MRHFRVNNVAEISDMLGDLYIDIETYSEMNRNSIYNVVYDFIGTLIKFPDFGLEYDDDINLAEDRSYFWYQGTEYVFVVEHRITEGHFKAALYELEHKSKLEEITKED